MVCDHCVLVIKNVLTELALDASSVHMGEVDFGNTTISIEQLQQFKHKIELLGFELINDKKTKLIENIKKLLLSCCSKKLSPKNLNCQNILQINYTTAIHN
ncbi:hypothetical protein MNBD_GAMMA22-91 [hydrothermal vent metagenome]|uniref:Uncharacterized protein n=1 Tax=hydrothermal vent metagenome TaxID=652676 RepID=A0A3B1APX3_9ZZZZ